MRFGRQDFKIVVFAVGFVACLLAPPRSNANAFGHSKVGLEFEYEATRPSTRKEDVTNHQLLLGFAREQFGGSKVRVEPWAKYMNATGSWMAGFKDAQGRKWFVVPEKMNGEKFDGFELITPPLESEVDVEKLRRLVAEIKNSGRFRAGYSSSTHFTYDVSHLVGPISGDPNFESRNIAEFVDVILFLESNIKSFYNLVEPERYGHVVNRYAVPLGVNQKELLSELAQLPRGARTFGRVRDIFRKYERVETALFFGDEVQAWKNRAFNYAKIFGLGQFKGAQLPVIEARIADLIEDPVKLSFVGELFSQAIAVGSKTPAFEFRDPFPGVKSFVNDSPGHFSLDELIRNNHPDRATAFLGKLGISRPFKGGRCEGLFAATGS